MVGRRDALGVEVVTEYELAAEDTAGPFGGEHLCRIHVWALRARSPHCALCRDPGDCSSMPGRSNSTTNFSPPATRPSALPRVEPAVPNTCWVKRSRSRNGSLPHQHGRHLQGSYLLCLDSIKSPIGTCFIYLGYAVFVQPYAQIFRSGRQELPRPMPDASRSHIPADEHAVYAISVAANYRCRNPIDPTVGASRTAHPGTHGGGTRRYSANDVARIGRITRTGCRGRQHRRNRTDPRPRGRQQRATGPRYGPQRRPVARPIRRVDLLAASEAFRSQESFGHNHLGISW